MEMCDRCNAKVEHLKFISNGKRVLAVCQNCLDKHNDDMGRMSL